MLRKGTWTEDVGMYSPPPAFEKLVPTKWPKSGWFRLIVGKDNIQSEAVASPKGKTPDFLQSILDQKSRGEIESAPPPAPDTEWVNEIYPRVPGSRLRSGVIPVYRFKNGTSMLRPQLDNRYTLKLDTQAFAFTVRNGLRDKNGVAYGEGAYYSIEYDGQSYNYELGQYGWDSTIIAIADLDGDGKPDFIITVGGSNSGYDAVLLSSKAKPGKNPATASLFQIGC